MAAERPLPEAPRQTFSKSERLCAKNDITLLLNKGRYFSVDGIFRVCILEREKAADGNQATKQTSPKARLLISVPKRHFKRAVRRNLLKRRIREAYRRNKPDSSVDVMVIYLPAEVLEYAQIESAMKEVIARIDAFGKQTDSPPKMSVKEVLKWIGNAPFLLVIAFYRTCISPFTPPACRFTPTCSQYAMEAFKKYGPFKGLYLSVKRILRCRPGGGSGYDPVP